MYAVIFRARAAGLDREYHRVVERMRKLAVEEYGCVEFTSLQEGDHEIAISYWEDEAQIRAWKNNPEHVLAQDLGRYKWYESYRVQITRIVREYGSTM